MEQQLGKTKLSALYGLLDQVIALEIPDANPEDDADNDAAEVGHEMTED
jgi:hypothetical protein